MLYSKAKLASACGGIIYFLSYVPYMYVAIREEVAHDKITAFEKCIAVSWLRLPGGAWPRICARYPMSPTQVTATTKLWAPHIPYTSHQTIGKPMHM